MDALAEDHLNDVMSNAVAIMTAVLATRHRSVWWVDPVGAILISGIIMYRWYDVILDQVKVCIYSQIVFLQVLLLMCMLMISLDSSNDFTYCYYGYYL